jgi:hypothetical protein
MSEYPNYATWRDVRLDCYEVVRWDDAKTWTVVQTNIRTHDKARQALAEWQAREYVHARMRKLETMELAMVATAAKLREITDA